MTEVPAADFATAEVPAGVALAVDSSRLAVAEEDVPEEVAAVAETAAAVGPAAEVVAAEVVVAEVAGAPA